MSGISLAERQVVIWATDIVMNGVSGRGQWEYGMAG